MVHIATEVHFLKMSSKVTQLAFYEDDLDIIEDSDADTLSLESVPKKELPSVRLKKSKKKPKSKWQIFLDKIASGTVFENHPKSRIQHCERRELRLHFQGTKVHQKCQKQSILASF